MFFARFPNITYRNRNTLMGHLKKELEDKGGLEGITHNALVSFFRDHIIPAYPTPRDLEKMG